MRASIASSSAGHARPGAARQRILTLLASLVMALVAAAVLTPVAQAAEPTGACPGPREALVLARADAVTTRETRIATRTAFVSARNAYGNSPTRQNRQSLLSARQATQDAAAAADTAKATRIAAKGALDACLAAAPAFSITDVHVDSGYAYGDWQFTNPPTWISWVDWDSDLPDALLFWDDGFQANSADWTNTPFVACSSDGPNPSYVTVTLFRAEYNYDLDVWEPRERTAEPFTITNPCAVA